MKIEIKSLMHGWKEVDKETARKYITHIKSGLTNVHSKDKISYIEKNKLRGITYNELFKGD